MEQFFSTIYYYTSGMYCQNLDNYLYATVPGYYHIGFVMIIVTLLASVMFYYLLKPVRKQNFWWFLVGGIAAGVNFLFGLWYTWTPIINNAVAINNSWSFLDSVFFSVTNAIWSFVFYVVIALIIKWWSLCKYVPFRVF
ncbi:MAG: hypothetical protein ACI30M_04095 [Muribaculaceae bacterium]